MTFRVTDEELARLKNSSNERGARCLSDFARSVLLGALEESEYRDENAGAVRELVQTLDSRMAMVESDVTRVMNLLSLAGEVYRRPKE